jgi:hypothetical protein
VLGGVAKLRRRLSGRPLMAPPARPPARPPPPQGVRAARRRAARGAGGAAGAGRGRVCAAWPATLALVVPARAAAAAPVSEREGGSACSRSRSEQLHISFALHFVRFIVFHLAADITQDYTADKAIGPGEL